MNKNHDINTLVSKLLTGEISEEEGKELLTHIAVTRHVTP